MQNRAALNSDQKYLRWEAQVGRELAGWRGQRSSGVTLVGLKTAENSEHSTAAEQAILTRPACSEAQDGCETAQLRS